MTQQEALALAVDNLDAFRIYDGDVSKVIKVDNFYAKGEQCTIRFQYPMRDGSVGHLMALIDGVHVEWG